MKRTIDYLSRWVHPSWQVVGFLTGVIVGGVVTLVIRWAGGNFWWGILAGVSTVVAILFSRRWMLVLAVIGGMCLMGWRIQGDIAGQKGMEGLVGEMMEMTGTVTEDPDTNEQGTTYRLGGLKIGERQVSGQVYVSGTTNRTIQRSDIVTIRGKMNAGFGTFSGFFYRPTVIKVLRLEPGDVFLKVRDFFAGKIREFTGEEEAALGLGYLLGVRSSLPEGLAETLKVVGLTHIIVASGANLSILIGVSRKILGKGSRFLGMMGSVLLVIFYVGMVGLSPSMVRAGMVALLSLFAWYVGREFGAGRMLVLVAAVTLLYNPMYIIDLGWLLSFGSFAGLMIVGPILIKFFYGDKKPGIIGGTVIETLSASLICAPILLYFFGTISLISLAANVLILPTIPIAMALTFATGVAGMLPIPAIASAVGWATNKILGYHLWVIKIFGAQENFLITIPSENPLVFLLYVPIVILLLYAKKNNVKVGNGNPTHQDVAFDRVDKIGDLDGKAIHWENLGKGCCK